MSKNSTLAPFIAHGILKMIERGIRDAYTKRHIISEPNCKPLKEEGQPLGMEKFAPLFVFYLVGCAVSLIIFFMENIFKPSSTSSIWHSQNNRSTLNALKQLLEKITINYEENVKEVGKMKEKSFEIRIRLIVPSFNAPGLRQM